MKNRADRLKRLVKVQEQIKALHEMRHAQHLAQAAEAERETSALTEAMNADSPMPGLFPDLYNRRIVASVEQRRRSAEMAREEASRVAMASARENLVIRAYSDALRMEDRARAEREQLEHVERTAGKSK